VSDPQDLPGRGTWEPIGWISVDGGTVAFGDAAAFPEAAPGPKTGVGRHGPVEDLTASGLPLVVCATGVDVDLPVEVVRDPHGGVVGARMCFTDDVDALEDAVEGSWTHTAALPITSGRCMASDPTCLPGPSYRFDFDVAPGVWSVDVFITGYGEEAEDCLGLRIAKSADARERDASPDPR
jgi:hypothetical protein